MAPQLLSSAMARDRFLFRAGRTGYTYPEVLEVRAGSVRLLSPSSTAKREQRAVSTLIAIAYVFVIGPILAVTGLPALGLVLGVGIGVALYFIGLVATLVWWDNRSLPLLAENPTYSLPLEILGIQSFGPFQEIRGRAGGREIRVSVSGRRTKVEEAVRFATPAGRPAQG
jgi:hypothetical protein